jgi:hypothetical protein
VPECANPQSSGPFGKRDYCWRKEKFNSGICVFFSLDLDYSRCRYFEGAVLPLDEDLKAIFSSEVLNLEIQESQKRAIRKKCERCPEIFLATNNRQRFCPKCQKAA